MRDFEADPAAARAKVVDALGPHPPNPPMPPDGFVAFDPKVIKATEAIAGDLARIYTGWNEFDLAWTFDDWLNAFLDPARDPTASSTGSSPSGTPPRTPTSTGRDRWPMS